MAHNPTEPSPTEALPARVRQAIERDVRPQLQAEGGDVELVGIDDDRIVQVRLLGACQGCASSVYTWTIQVESLLRAQVPEVRFVEAVP
jgi:Fe-S cluster biogenesis protein NfuA